jgi:uncharacterized protein
MKKQEAYSLPILGLLEGVHEYRFEINADFFKAFENSKLTEGDIVVDLTLDKRASHIDMEFAVSGEAMVTCDRCLEEFSLPLDFSEHLLLKYSEVEKEDYEVVYIKRDRDSFDVTQYLYEFIHLAVPMVTTHDMAGQECDPDMLDILEANEFDQEDNDENSSNSAWSALKDIKLD